MVSVPHVFPVRHVASTRALERQAVHEQQRQDRELKRAIRAFLRGR